MEFNKYLRELRKSKNLTQKQLAELVGCNFQQIARWEKGENFISFDKVVDIANGLNMKINPQLFIPKNND